MNFISHDNNHNSFYVQCSVLTKARGCYFESFFEFLGFENFGLGINSLKIFMHLIKEISQRPFGSPVEQIVSKSVGRLVNYKKAIGGPDEQRQLISSKQGKKVLSEF